MGQSRLETLVMGWNVLRWAQMLWYWQKQGKWAGIGLNALKWVKIGWNGCGWAVLSQHGFEWAEMGWSGLEWNGMSWNEL